jgi:YD repeat-containing protein
MSKKWLLSTAGFVLVALIATAQGNCFAQTAPQVPATPLIDENGVDISKSMFSGITASVGIGSDSSHLGRTGNAFPIPYTDDFTGGINTPSSSVWVVTVGIHSEQFNLDSSSTWVSQSGSGNTLVCSGGFCNYTFTNGTVATFDQSQKSNTGGTSYAPGGLLVKVTYPDGEVIQINYRTDGNASMPQSTIKTVWSSLGWTLKYQVLNNDPTNIKPVQIHAFNSSVDYCDPSGEGCTGLTTDRVLNQGGNGTSTSNATVTDATGNTTTYTFNSLDWVASIVNPSGVTTTITYPSHPPTSNYSYMTVTRGGATWNYTFTRTTNSSGEGITTTAVTNPNGTIKTYIYNGTRSRLESVTDELGRKTSYAYDSSGRVIQIIAPDATYSGTTLTGGYTAYAYDARGNVVTESVYPRSGGTPIVTSAAYPSTCANRITCDKPTSVTTSTGVTTNYEYDPVHGGITKATRQAVGGVSSQVRYTYQQITPSVRTASGYASQPPVWRLTGISSCMTQNLAVCVGTTDEVKKTISYGSSNTNPTYRNVLPVSETTSRGDGSLSQTLSYTYDNYGNHVSIDGPKPGAVDTTYYFYDILGRQTGVINMDPDGSGTRNRLAYRDYYDGDGRLYRSDSGTVTGTNSAALNAMSVIESDVSEYSSNSGLPIVARQYMRGTLVGVKQISYNNMLLADCVVERLNPSSFPSITSTSACTATSGPDGNDRVVKYAYDGTGAILSITEGYGTSLARPLFVRTYDPASGLLKTLADGKGNLTTIYYDNFDRRTKTCYPTPNNGGVTNTADCDQTLFSGTNPALPSGIVGRNGQTVNFTFDAAARLISKSGAISETLTYNNFDQVLTHTNSSTGERHDPKPTPTTALAG